MPKCDYKSKQKLTNMTCSSKTMTMTRGTTITGERQPRVELEAAGRATEQQGVQPVLEEGRMDGEPVAPKETGRIVGCTENDEVGILRNMDQKTFHNLH